jgi:chromosome segregation ATPase
MAISDLLRRLVGPAPQPDQDAAARLSQCAAEARAAADAMERLAAEMRTAHIESVGDLRNELERLSSRVEAMPEMRAQLEIFVQSLGRTMTGAADRLETVDDRIERLEQQARTQTDIISLVRTEFDRQGRLIAGFEAQIKSLEESAARIAAVAERSSESLRGSDARRGRSERSLHLAWAAIGTLALLVVLVFFRR